MILMRILTMILMRISLGNDDFDEDFDDEKKR